MTSYRLARSLEVLRAQIDALSPNRSKASDGWIGDAAHASRSSDHNPWVKDARGVGVVTALDVTHDPAHGVDGSVLAEELIRSRDPRIKYIIWNRRICAGADGPSPWTWRAYGGSNKHTKHVHISVEDEENPPLYDVADEWRVDLRIGDEQRRLPEQPPARPTLRRGSPDREAVRVAQRLLNSNYGYGLKEDGDFGPRTERAVKFFQTERGLHPDGVVGAYTWAELESKE